MLQVFQCQLCLPNMFLCKSSKGANFIYPALPTMLLIKHQETGSAVLRDQRFKHQHTTYLAIADPSQKVRPFWKNKNLTRMVEIASHELYIKINKPAICLQVCLSFLYHCQLTFSYAFSLTEFLMVLCNCGISIFWYNMLITHMQLYLV